MPGAEGEEEDAEAGLVSLSGPSPRAASPSLQATSPKALSQTPSVLSVECPWAGPSPTQLSSNCLVNCTFQEAREDVDTAAVKSAGPCRPLPALCLAQSGQVHFSGFFFFFFFKYHSNCDYVASR